MARKKQSETRRSGDDDGQGAGGEDLELLGGGAAPGVDDEDADDLSLMRAAQELGAAGGEVRIHVRRVNPNREQEECFSCHPDEFTLERIRDDWGPGTYRVVGRKHGAIQFNKKVILARMLERPVLPVAPPAPDLGSVMREFMDQVSKQQMTMLDSMKDLVISTLSRGPAAPQIDPMLMQKNMLDGLAQMKNFLTPAAAPAASADPISMLLKGIDLARDLGPRGGGESGISDVVLEAIKTFGKPIAEAAASAGSVPMLPGGFPAETPVAGMVAAPSAAPSVAPQVPNMMIVIKQQLAMLVRQAKLNKDPSLYAELVLDNLPTETVRGFIGRPDALEQMILLNTEVGSFRPWFEELRSEIVRMLQEEGQGDPAPGAGLTPAVPPGDATAQILSNGAANVSRPGAAGAGNTDEPAKDPIGSGGG